MFDPTKPDAILSVEDKDLGRLPSAEDDLHEYKSALTRDNDLAEKIGKAASAFWNSGGGLFAAGVNGLGKPDGGITSTVGRQPRREWIDQAVARVSPLGRHFVHLVEDKGSCPNIKPRCAVALIAFSRSESGPHWAPDSRCYIRAGAHTEAARPLLVEGMWARRQVFKPSIVHILRLQQETSETSTLSIELAAATSAAATHVVAELLPRPKEDAGPSFPLRTNLIDATHPFVFRFEIPSSGYSGRLLVRYRDLSNREYEYTAPVDSTTCLLSWHGARDPLGQIAYQIGDINNNLRRLSLKSGGW
jgi:hypothetical protein